VQLVKVSVYLKEQRQLVPARLIFEKAAKTVLIWFFHVAIKLGLVMRTYSYYENAQSNFTVKRLVKLCNVFHKKSPYFRSCKSI